MIVNSFHNFTNGHALLFQCGSTFACGAGDGTPTNGLFRLSRQRAFVSLASVHTLPCKASA